MWKFRSFKSALKPILSSLGHKPRSASGNGAPGIKIPGMVCSDELAFFGESAARYVGKEGAIVDLGCWMGSTSIALARGILSRSPKADIRGEKVLGFDTFTWDEWMPASIPYCVYRPGESFLPEARRVVRDHGGGVVELIQADLTLYEWKADPIKILLVDAMKSEELTCQITRNFFPSLMTGSLLIHQDFKHYYTSWLHILQYRLRQFFRPYQNVVGGGTTAFEVLGPISREAVDRAVDFAGITNEEIDTSFRHSLDLVGSGDCANVAAAHVMHYVHLGRKDQGLEKLEIYRSSGMSDKGEFPNVLNYFSHTG